MPVAPFIMVLFSKFNFSSITKLETKPHNNICAIKFRGFAEVAKLNHTRKFVDLQYSHRILTSEN